MLFVHETDTAELHKEVVWLTRVAEQCDTAALAQQVPESQLMR